MVGLYLNNFEISKKGKKIIAHVGQYSEQVSVSISENNFFKKQVSNKSLRSNLHAWNVGGNCKIRNAKVRYDVMPETEVLVISWW